MSDWVSRKQFRITNSLLSAATDYQIRFQVYRSTGTDSATNVYVGTNCQEDFSDIRWTDSTGIDEGLYEYWIESPTTSAVATCWVKMRYLPANSATTVYLYYNNPNGVSACSSGSNTFPFFDDFSGASLDTDKWTQVNGVTPSFSSGYMTATADGNDPGKIIATAATTGDNTVFTARFKVVGGSNVEGRAGLSIKTGVTGRGYNFVVEDFTNVDGVKFLNDLVAWGSDLDNWAKDTWYVFDIVHDGTNVKGRIDGGTWRSVAWSGRKGNPALNIGSFDEVTVWDYAFTRAYAATEPTISSWTTESVTEITQDTFAYRLVGWEYDQMKGLFNLEFGAPDDYYMSNDVKYKGAVDVSLSLL